MEIFLKLKHWQIFLIWIFGAFQLPVFMKTDFWFISFGLYLFIILGWIYSIGKFLNRKNEKTEKITSRIETWLIIYILSVIPYGIHFRNMMSESYERVNLLIMIISGIFGLVAIVKIVSYSAKSLKEYETKPGLSFNNYLLEFVLILYCIIGIWFIQPRLNKILKNKTNTRGNTV